MNFGLDFRQVMSMLSQELLFLLFPFIWFHALLVRGFPKEAVEKCSWDS